MQRSIGRGACTGVCVASLFGTSRLSCPPQWSATPGRGMRLVKPTTGPTVGRCIALQQQRRLQSSVADKKFHCSVCKKAFRLEMAAKVHLQQAHNGEGTIETGSGPGQANSDAPEAAPVGVARNTPPQGPTIVAEAVVPEERPLRRRSKPTPKPLHEPYRDVPVNVLEEMLAVWDTVGVKRLQGKFIHSSMIMKVFAAKPDAGSEPLYDPVEPEGENPFGNVSQGDADVSLGAVEEHNIYDIDLNDAFALATDEYHGPFRVARCENPFGKAAGVTPAGNATRNRTTASTAVAPASPATANGGSEEAPQTAPVTPYGQLPMFGQAPAPLPSAGSAPEASGVVASPFGSSAANSPFAQEVTSPFVASPFAAQDALPDRAQAAATSPFMAPTSAGAASPFTAMGADSPFAATAPSPFLASPFLSAPGSATTADAGAFAAFSGPTAFPPYQPVGAVGAPFSAMGGPDGGLPEPAPAPKHDCEQCGKSFSSYEGMRMHAKAKHGVELPPSKEKNGKARTVPELPAYIPSPVDLSMTAPFHKGSAERTWSETEIVPHAVSVSNITIVGKVVAVEQLDPSTLQLTVFVQEERKEDCETLTVRCAKEKASTLPEVSQNDTVFVSGTLRLLPIHDAVVDRYFSTPIIFAGSPTGLVQRIC